MIIIDFICACLLFFVFMFIEIFLRWLLMKLIKPTKVDEYKETKIDKIIERVFVISILLMILLALVLGFATKSNAATSGVLPYIPSSTPYGLDSSQVDIFIDSINQFDSTFDTSKPFIIFTSQQNSWYDYNHNVASPTYTVYFPEYTTINNGYFLTSSFPNNTNFGSYSTNTDTFLLVTFNNFTSFTLIPRSIGTTYNGYQVTKGQGQSGSSKGFFGGSSPVTVQNAYFDFTYLPDYPSYTSTSWFTSDGSQTKVFLTYSKIIPGQVTDPDIVDTSDLPNTDPDIDDYLPTTPEPTIDNTSLESLVESLFGWLKWQFLQFKGFVSFLADKFGYLIGKVLSGLNNAINALVDNLKSLFKPLLDSINGFLDNIKTTVQTIKEQFDYLLEPVDSQAINSAIEDTNFYGVYNDFVSFFDDFDTYFNSISEPDSFIITIYLSRLSYFTLPDFQLNLGSLIIPFRNSFRIFIWVLVTFGSVFLVSHNLPSWLMGSDSGKKGGKNP